VPEFTVTSPDGKTYVIAGPEGSTQAQALQKAIEQHNRTLGDYQLSEAASSLEKSRAIGALNPDVYGNIVAAGEPEIDPYALHRGPSIPTDKANFGASVKAGVIADPETQRREIAKSLFPDDPNGAQRVGFIDGSPVYVDDQGQLKRVSPSMVKFLAESTANIPEAVGATVGSFATGNPISGAAVGGAGGRAAKRLVSEMVFDEPATPLSVAKEMATEGAVNLAAGALGKGIAAFSGRGRIIDFSPQNVRTAEQARAYIKQSTGIDLDLAQASGDRKLLALRDYAATYPGRTAELIQAADEATAGQLDVAVNRVLDSIAKSTPSEIAGKQGMNAAQLVMRAVRGAVQKEVDPLYKAAYAAVPVVDRTTKQGEHILDFLKLPYFKEAFSAGQKLRALETGSAAQPSRKVTETLTKQTDEAIERAQTTVQSTPTGARKVTSRLTTENRPRETADGVLTRRDETVHTDITGPSLAELDYTKRALDERIEALKLAGQRQRAAALTVKRNEFVAALDALPNQQWQAARKKYAELAQSSIEPMENGIVGVLAGIEDPLASRAAVKIFSDPNVTPQAIALAKTALEKQSPEAYAGLVRQYLAHNWNKALKETQSGDVINPAGKFRQALFGTPADRERTRAMLPAGASSAFDDLMLAMEKLARTPLGASRVAGSPTFTRGEIDEQLKGQGALVFKWLTSPRRSIQEAAEDRVKQQSIVAITEALLDPAKRSQLRQVARMQPSTRQAILLGSILGGQAVKVAADDFTVPDIDPQESTQQ
jgi:hypothetical protein